MFKYSKSLCLNYIMGYLLVMGKYITSDKVKTARYSLVSMGRVGSGADWRGLPPTAQRAARKQTTLNTKHILYYLNH